MKRTLCAVVMISFFVSFRLSAASPIRRKENGDRSSRPDKADISVRSASTGDKKEAIVSNDVPEYPADIGFDRGEPRRVSRRPPRVREPIRHPLSVGLTFWPYWILFSQEFLAAPMPPIMEVSVGVRKEWFGFDFFVGFPLRSMVEGFGNIFGLGITASAYSVRMDRFRVKHGVSLGVMTDIEYKRRQVDFSTFYLPLVRLTSVSFLVRLHGRLWAEIAPATLGFPSIYEMNFRIRYEL